MHLPSFFRSQRYARLQGNGKTVGSTNLPPVTTSSNPLMSSCSSAPVRPPEPPRDSLPPPAPTRPTSEHLPSPQQPPSERARKRRGPQETTTTPTSSFVQAAPTQVSGNVPPRKLPRKPASPPPMELPGIGASVAPAPGSSCDSAYATTPTSGGSGGGRPSRPLSSSTFHAPAAVLQSQQGPPGHQRAPTASNGLSSATRPVELQHSGHRMQPPPMHHHHHHHRIRDCGSETSSCGDSSVTSPETPPIVCTAASGKSQQLFTLAILVNWKWHPFFVKLWFNSLFDYCKRKSVFAAANLISAKSAMLMRQVMLRLWAYDTACVN